RDGPNAIALDVFHNDSSDTNHGYLTFDMVDWNPTPADGWTGLQFAPTLETDGAVSVRNAHVVQANAADLSSSDLTVKADVRNNTERERRERQVVLGSRASRAQHQQRIGPRVGVTGQHHLAVLRTDVL